MSEVHVGKLIAVALVVTAAYERAQIDSEAIAESDLDRQLAVAARQADVRRYMPGPRPVVNLDPVRLTNRFGNV